MTDVNLLDVALHPGETVRFRRRDDERWKDGVVSGLEPDGSIRLRDDRHASRSIPVERIQVRATGPRGGNAWIPLTDRISGTEQLGLF